MSSLFTRLWYRTVLNYFHANGCHSQCLEYSTFWFPTFSRTMLAKRGFCWPLSRLSFRIPLVLGKRQRLSIQVSSQSSPRNSSSVCSDVWLVTLVLISAEPHPKYHLLLTNVVSRFWNCINLEQWSENSSRSHQDQQTRGCFVLYDRFCFVLEQRWTRSLRWLLCPETRGTYLVVWKSNSWCRLQ